MTLSYNYTKRTKPKTKRLTYSVLGFEQAAQMVDDAVHAGDFEVFLTLLGKRKTPDAVGCCTCVLQVQHGQIKKLQAATDELTVLVSLYNHHAYEYTSRKPHIIL